MLVSHDDLSKAVSEAIEVGVEVISHTTGLDWYEACVLASMTMDVEISQVASFRNVKVNPRRTYSLTLLTS